MSSADPVATAVEIIDFEPSLAAHFRDLNVEWLEKYFRVEALDHEVLNNPIRLVIEPGGAILFARVGADIVGTAALKHHGDAVYELTKMAVTERSQGLGIGRRLLEASIERYRELGGEKLYLESQSGLGTAVGLYERSGFEHATPPRPPAYERADVYMVYRGNSR